MDGRFKCCKTKEFPNYCCVVCLGVFHPACLDRTKTRVKLGGHRIYCSSKCQTRDDSDRERSAKYLEEIQRLQNECLERDLLVSRMKRQSHQFEQDILDVEKSYTSDLALKNDTISSLKERLNKFEVENGKLLLEIENYKGSEQQIKKDLDEMGRINESMLASIRVLEHENEVCGEELKRVKCELVKMVDGQSAVEGCNGGEDLATDRLLRSSKMPMRASDADMKQCDSRKKLLVLCDQTGYGIGSELGMYLRDYQIQSIIKPHAPYESVIEDIVKLSERFGGDDCIVIMAGVNNFARGRHPSFRELNSRLKHVTHTNIVLASLPLNFSGRYKKFVRKYNNVLEQYAARLNRYACAKVSFLDLSGCASGEQGMRLARCVTARKKVGDSNLVFVKTHGPVNELGDSILPPRGHRSLPGAGRLVSELEIHRQRGGVHGDGYEKDLSTAGEHHLQSNFLETTAVMTSTT